MQYMPAAKTTAAAHTDAIDQMSVPAMLDAGGGLAVLRSLSRIACKSRHDALPLRSKIAIKSLAAGPQGRTAR